MLVKNGKYVSKILYNQNLIKKVVANGTVVYDITSLLSIDSFKPELEYVNGVIRLTDESWCELNMIALSNNMNITDIRMGVVVARHGHQRHGKKKNVYTTELYKDACVTSYHRGANTATS